MKIYLAAPFGTPAPGDIKRYKATLVYDMLINKGFDVYAPWKMVIPNAWDYPNDEWGRLVFEEDKKALDECDVVVMLSYGRESTAGTNWEAGYAYGLGKKVIVVEMTGNIMSLMVSNGCHARLSGLTQLQKYDFATMPAVKETKTEQK